MKIWYFSAYDQPNGHSSRTFWYASELAKRGHKVTMLTNSYCHFTHVEMLTAGDKWKVEQIDGVLVVRLKTIAYGGNGWKRAVNMLLNAYRCLQFARQAGEVPDVVIGPSVPILTGWAASHVARSKSAAFIYEIRDLWPQALVDLGKIRAGGLTERIFKIIERSLYNRAFHIVSALPYAYRHIEKFGVARNKITWIPNGVDLNPFEKIKEYGGGEPGYINLLYLGRFAAGHDINTILDCALILKEKYAEKMRFIIIGDGPDKEKYYEKVKVNELNNVEFQEMVPKSEVASKCAMADILIASIHDISVFKYGINLNKLYDYFASGRPVILSANTPNDPVTDSGAGITVKAENPRLMAEAIISIFNMSPTDRAVMGMKAKNYARQYYDKCVLTDKYELILNKWLSDSN